MPTIVKREVGRSMLSVS